MFSLPVLVVHKQVYQLDLYICMLSKMSFMILRPITTFTEFQMMFCQNVNLPGHTPNKIVIWIILDYFGLFSNRTILRVSL